MSKYMMTAVLAAHADRLLRGEAREAEYLALFPEYRKDMEPLLALARQIREMLAFVRPSEAFRNRLRQELLTSAAAEESDAQPSDERPLWRQPWVIGAAALGSAISVASAVGVIIHRRRAKGSKPAAATS
jgi:hypothetical protein